MYLFSKALTRNREKKDKKNLIPSLWRRIVRQRRPMSDANGGICTWMGAWKIPNQYCRERFVWGLDYFADDSFRDVITNWKTSLIDLPSVTFSRRKITDRSRIYFEESPFFWDWVCDQVIHFWQSIPLWLLQNRITTPKCYSVIKPLINLRILRGLSARLGVTRLKGFHFR